MSDLLKEAIADAKAVRETALANAKLQLEEAFTPKLESMISEKIKNEVEDDEMDHAEDEVSEELDSSEIGDGHNEPDEDAKTSSKIGESRDTKTEQDGESEDSESGDNYDDDEDEMDEAYDEDEDDDLDLDEIISELEAELSEAEYDDEDHDSEHDSVDEMSHDDDHDEEKAAEPVEEGEYGDDEDEEIDLDEIFRVLSEMDSEEDEDEEPVDESAELRNRIVQLETELAEYRDAVVFMKDKLQEVNLLNAKLLYANKLFRAYDLQQENKVRVIETLDRTNSVREVKLVYTTLAESFKFSGTKRKNRISTTMVVAEGNSSQTAGSTAPDKEILSEGNTTSERWKYLANINK